MLGGKHRGDWQMDFTAGSPVYTGSGTLTGISLEQMAKAMHDPWISGTAVGTYQIKASGADSAAFWQSAEGGLQFDLRDGVLPHISLARDEGTAADCALARACAAAEREDRDREGKAGFCRGGDIRDQRHGFVGASAGFQTDARRRCEAASRAGSWFIASREPWRSRTWR